jgi:hypothetical protein
MRRFSLLLGLAACVADSPPAARVRIHDVQGSAQVSPLAGQVVHDLPGVVTAIGPHGFWLQDPVPDGDPATSEGLFVHLDPPRVDAGPLAPGDELRVDGRVVEYVPPRRAGQLPVTELDEARVRLVGSGRPLPAATRVGRGGRRPPTEVICDDAPGGDALASVFDPEHDGLDFWESLEGMLVEIDDPVACSPSSSLD